MLGDFPTLQGPYLRDLLSQPQALTDTIASLRQLRPMPPAVQHYSRIVLTGMGSSFYALHPLQIHLVQAGRTALMVETAELIHSQSNMLDEHTLIVAVSQSGRSAETLSLLELIHGRVKRPYVVGVTNTPDSPLAMRADSVVKLQAGEEFSVSCKTYLATLAALEWVGGALCGENLKEIVDELEDAPPAVKAYLSARHQHVQQLIDELKNIQHLFITGRGKSLAAVGTGALILKESTRFHAEGMSSPAFRHGPLEMVDGRLYALVFAGDPVMAPLNESLMRDIRSAGGCAVLVSEHAEPGVFRLSKCATRLRPIMEMLPVQMVSLALAALAGREPGRFEHATKVTATE